MTNDELLIFLGTDPSDSRDQLAWLSRDQLAWLSGDQLAWLKELQEKTPKLELPYTQIMQATNGCTANFDMSSWHHSCNTTHCAAGWIVTKAGEAGKTLKREFDTPTAARLILRKSCPADWPLPNFYAKNDAAAAFIRAMAAKEAAL